MSTWVILPDAIYSRKFFLNAQVSYRFRIGSKQSNTKLEYICMHSYILREFEQWSMELDNT